MVKRLYEKYGVSTVFLFAALPLPFDIVGILCGLVKLDPKIFFAMTFAGKTTGYLVYAYSGKEAFDVFLSLSAGKVNLPAIIFISLVLALIVSSFMILRLTVLRQTRRLRQDFENDTTIYQDP